MPDPAPSPSSVRLSLPPDLTPREALSALAGMPDLALLESAGEGSGTSLLSAAPRLSVSWEGSGLQLSPAPGVSVPRLAGESRDPFAFLSLFPLTAEGGGGPGGWIGFFAYEIGELLESLPPRSAPPCDLESWPLPLLRLGAYDWWIIWRPGRPPELEGNAIPGVEGGRSLEERAREVEGRIMENRGIPQSDHGIAGEVHPDPAVPTRSSLSRESFQAGVETIRARILEGELFQANLTRIEEASLPGSPEALYRALMACSPAPYGAFLEWSEGAVASISPESFLSVRGRRVSTRPIKGTAPRYPDPRRDQESREELGKSRKDRAENIMIVDLLRNDLSRVAEPGTVAVPRLLEVETHPTVHHLASTVTARLRRGIGPEELLRATLPGGSITGAPKVRAMEILRELEPIPRGVYTGAIGVVTFRGSAELSVAIRTATVREGVARYGTGGGVTLASDPAEEWEETCHKARAFHSALERVRAHADKHETES